MPDQVDWRTMEREASPGRAVGRLLRDQREARGLTLKAVEMALRIRLQHLEAIEQGRFDLLPGAAYIPAFLRAYAQHVGLDPEKVLTAYHLSGAVPIKRPMALPADFPLAEKRAPIGLAVLTVLLVVGAGYAVWHYLPRQQSIVAEKVPPVPDRLLASRPSTVEQPTSATLPAVPTQAAAPTQAQVPAPEVRSTAGGALPASTWPATPQASVPATPPPAVVAVPAPPPPVVMSVPSVGQAQAAQPVAPEPPRAVPSATPDPQEATARSTITTTPVPPVVAAPAPTPAIAPAPQTLAPQTSAPQTPALQTDVTAAPLAPVKADTRVVVRTNSWVELRAPDGDILAQTDVRAGESYTVPAGISYRIIDAR
jgi:cytoskeleton protein RodZ